MTLMDLEEFISENNVFALQAAAHSNPQFLFEYHLDHFDVTSLQYILRFASNALCIAILDEVKKLDRIDAKKLLAQTDYFGNTAVHYAARHCTSEVFFTLAEILDNDIKEYTQQVNKGGELPLQLALLNSNIDAQDICTFLENNTPDGAEEMKKPFIPSFEFEEMSELGKNLRAGFRAVNYARNWIHTCVTHPLFNKINPDVFDSQIKIHNMIKSEYGKEIENIKLDQFSDPSHYNLKKLEININSIKKYRISNCVGYSCLVLESFFENGLFAELYSIANGSHVFAVCGRPDYTNPYDFKAWGNSAVVVNAWDESNPVFRASQIPEKMRAYYFYSNPITNKNLNITIPFNSNYHEIEPCNYITLPRTLQTTSSLQQFNLFNVANQSPINEPSIEQRQYFQPINI